ncbi:MAG TPA: alkaline phosphatase family protein [Solirubrobacteraceae bacterium]|jgi:hypothetical protein
MSISDPTATGPRSTLRCAGCDTRLATDQRYCVECGARRGPLSPEIGARIGAIHEPGPTPSLPEGTPLADCIATEDQRPQAFGLALPGPRATAIAVMGMLAFGVIIGSLAGGQSVESLASAPLIVVNFGHSAGAPAKPVAVVAQSAGSNAGSNAGAGSFAAGGAGGGSVAAASPQDTQASASPTTSPTSTTTTDNSSGFNGLPPVKHVFLIMLSDRGFTQSFGSSGGYLGGALRRQGELLQNYYAVAAAPLANEIAVLSGQGPTVQTATDCPVFASIKSATKGPRGQVLGNGCAYPTSTKTLASQLTTARDSWKAYLQGVPSSAKSACRVPKAGSKVPQTAGSKNAYLAWRNPFVYFRALTGSAACRNGEASFGQLAKDLKRASSTPSLAYIIPASCNDGSEAACRPKAPTGLAAANRFLKSAVPEIKRSPAYKDGGMIAITFDQAPQTGQYADPSACCSSPASYPNLRGLPAGTPIAPPAAMGTPTTPATTTGTTTTAPGSTTPTDTGTAPATTTTTPPVSLGSGETTPTGGGGQVGLLLISHYVKPNSTDVVDYFNHFSLLATIENLFGLHRLGYAGVPALPVFSTGVFNNYSGG